jgi:leader peptidase (prepilin peptidase) / N-methyltransferase
MLPVIVLAVIAGWLAAAVANYFADVLPDLGAPPTTGAMPSAHKPLWRYLAPDRRGRGAGRIWALQLALPLVYVALTWRYRYGMTDAWIPLVIAWLYAAFLLAVLVIDLEHRRVLNVMLAPAAPVVLLLSLVPGMAGPVSSLLGGAAGFGLFLLIFLLSRGKMGAGDVKLAGLIGLMLGYPAAIYALLWGIILGGIAALLLLVTRKVGRKSYIAYAPYLSVGALIVLLRLWGG